jgi:hypothetical protein
MIVKDATESSNRVSLGLKCGDCTHLAGPAAFEKPCIQLGKTSFAEACPNFTPDLMKISIVKKGHLGQLAELAQALSQNQTRLFAYVFRNIDLIKKSGYEFGEEVVFSIGGDYLECYVRGRVVGADRAATQVYISSDFEGLNGESCMLTLLRPSVMNMTQYAKKRKSLILEGRIAEPKFGAGSRKRTTLQCLKMTPEERALYRQTLATKPDEYVPPSIDTVPSNWLDSRMLDRMIDSKGAAKKAVSKTTLKSGRSTKDGFNLQGHTNATRKNSGPKSKRK